MRTSRSPLGIFCIPETTLLLLSAILAVAETTLKRQLYHELGMGGNDIDTLYLCGMLLFALVALAIGGTIVVLTVKAVSWLVKKRIGNAIADFQLLLALCLVVFVLRQEVHSDSAVLLGSFAVRLNQKADVEAIRKWAHDYVALSEDGVTETLSVLEVGADSPRPDCIQVLRPTLIRIVVWGRRTLLVRLQFGGQLFPRWGLDVVDPSDSWYTPLAMALGRTPRYEVEWRKGAYMWHSADDQSVHNGGR